MKTPFCAVLATGYYDGPTQGLLLGLDGRVFVFDLLSSRPFDDGHDMKVYSVSLVGDVTLTTQAQSLPWRIDGVRVLPPDLPDVQDQILSACEHSARPCAVLAATDLLGPVAAWWPVTDQVRGDSTWTQTVAAAFLERYEGVATPG